jgi:hypothetical protein
VQDLEAALGHHQGEIDHVLGVAPRVVNHLMSYEVLAHHYGEGGVDGGGLGGAVGVGGHAPATLIDDLKPRGKIILPLHVRC